MRIDSDMRRVVEQQGLCFVATVCPDGTPNLSPKGTIAVWGDDHLVFLHLYSPQTIANLAHNAAIEVNLVDPIIRKGYRFKGTAEVLTTGATHDEVLHWFHEQRGTDPSRVKAVVMIAVDAAAPVVSPVYATGVSEAEVARYWRDRHVDLANAHVDD